MNKFNFLIIGLIFLFVTISCDSMMRGKQETDVAVERFHSDFNAQRFDEIYDDSDEKFKQTTSREEFTDLLETTQRKFGKINDSSLISWKLVKTDNKLVTVIYNVEFSEVEGREEFTFHIIDDKALLYNYKIKSR
jgi:hypothetical protein